MSDRRRINGPSSGTIPPVFSKFITNDLKGATHKRSRSRPPNVLRKMFLKTGVTPSASGSAYLELEASGGPVSTTPGLASLSASGLKLTCTVHGPRPLPKSAPFSPHIILSTHVKYAPFATRRRRGFVRDATERDLGVHLETALRGVIIGDRWPKSGVEVIVTILEGEENQRWGNEYGIGSFRTGEWGDMSVLSGCITVASAAIADAGIDCVDMVSGGVAAVVREPASQGKQAATTLVLDPVPSEHDEIIAACIIAYLPTRDEITDVWVKGELDQDDDMSQQSSTQSSLCENLTENAAQAALGAHLALIGALKETADIKLRR